MGTATKSTEKMAPPKKSRKITKNRRNQSTNRTKPTQPTTATATITTTTITTIESLPPEILHMIFNDLSPRDAASFRYISRPIAQIGIEYLVNDLNILVRPEGWDELLAHSEHPIVSKQISRIMYEADLVLEIAYEEWKSKLTSSRDMAGYAMADERFVGFPEPPASRRRRTGRRQGRERQWALFDRRVERFMEPWFPRLYEEFRMRCRAQRRVRGNDYNSEIVARAMRGFTNLKELRMSLQCAVSGDTETFKLAFGHGYLKNIAVDIRDRNLGIAPTYCLLKSAQQAGLRIEYLQCGMVSWRLLLTTNPDFPKIKEILSHLTALDVILTIQADDVMPDIMDEVDYCTQNLNDGNLSEFFTTAPNLKRLMIFFHDKFALPESSLRNFTGTFHWRYLEMVNFLGLAVDENSLVNFCQRHAATLEHLRLNDMRMEDEDGGNWSTTFRRMRQCLKLKKVGMTGTFWTGREVEFDFSAEDDEEGYSARTAVEVYLLENEGKDVSLTEFRENLNVEVVKGKDRDGAGFLYP